MEPVRIKFNNADRPEFVKELRKRVNSYFKENNKSKYANANMVIKTIFMLSLYFIPYFVVTLNLTTNSVIIWGMWTLMGLGMSGIGFSVMHDANHGAYSKNQNINKYLGYLINIIGGSSVNWKIQHNVLHHTYTNIDGHDEDLNGSLMRFSHRQKRIKAHRFQQFYAWFLYSLITVAWSTKKDFIQLKRYKGKDLLKTQNTTYRKAFTKLVMAKVVYISFILVLPLIFSSQAWWLTLLFYFIMHFTSGLLISVIFQLAHVVGETDFPEPKELTGEMDNNWAAHQLYTTANFGKKNLPLSWFVGGLNFQIEHHLFPNICHVHYRKISDIVKTTAQEFDLPYYQNTFLGAISSHAKHLKKLGKYDMV